MSDDKRFPDASTLTEAEKTWAIEHGMSVDRYAGMKGVRTKQDLDALDQHLAEKAKTNDNDARIAELRAQIEALGGAA